jgi:hypothetical protein
MGDAAKFTRSRGGLLRVRETGIDDLGRGFSLKKTDASASVRTGLKPRFHRLKTCAWSFYIWWSFVRLHIKGREPDKTPCSRHRENTPILFWINNLARARRR